MRSKQVKLFVAATLLLLTLSSVPPALAAPSSADPSADQVAGIESVIQQANQEQVQAVATGNPAVMQDTATASYYQQAAQGVNDLLSAGVNATQLVSLQWGPITLQDANTAQATTSETWSTTFTDGSTLQETDTNVYTVVLDNGAWKVQDDQHPGTGAQTTASNSGAGTATTPATPAVPFTPAAAVSSDSQSRNWSGYAAMGGSFTAVSGTWIVPNVSAGNSVATDATWVGVGGVTTTDLIQAGTQALVQGGQVTYSAWWETLPKASQQVPINVSAGDSVTVSIAQQADGSWQIRISDATDQQTWQNTIAYQSSFSSAEWIEEAPVAARLGLLPLDNFGQIVFTNASTMENGQTTTPADANAQPIAMNNGAGQALAQASVLAADGNGFIVARTSATSAAPSAGGRRFSGGAGLQ